MNRPSFLSRKEKPQANIKSESLLGKMLLGFFDKVIFGAFALLITFYAQDQAKEREDRQQLWNKGTSVFDGFIAKQREVVSEEFSKYVLLVEQNKTRGGINPADAKAAKDEITKIRVAVFQMSTFSETLKGKGDKLAEQLNLLYIILKDYDKAANITQIDEDLNGIKQTYWDLMTEIQKTAMSNVGCSFLQKTSNSKSCNGNPEGVLGFIDWLFTFFGGGGKQNHQ